VWLGTRQEVSKKRRDHVSFSCLFVWGAVVPISSFEVADPLACPCLDFVVVFLSLRMLCFPVRGHSNQV